MSGMNSVLIGELLLEARPGFACGDVDPNGIPQFRMNNVARDGSIDYSKLRRVPPEKARIDTFGLRGGDVLFNATNSPDLVGKTALFIERDEPTVFSNHFLRLRAGDQLYPSYLSRFLQMHFTRGTFRGMCRQWVNQATVGREAVLGMKIPLPPIEEQWRIAGILDHADALRAKRREALARLDELGNSIYADMFVDQVCPVRHVRLDEVSEIVSGITKGRKVNGAPLRKVPYLAVANVQDKKLNLIGIKTIEATDAEIARWRVQRDDLLLTEGGDPDKLGRGSLWREELPEAIHQNHVFRVRPDISQVDPTYLNWTVGSSRGKAYFLRSAKQTTGIASINSTQLKAFPLKLPPIAIQERFSRRVRGIESVRDRHRTALAELDALVASLQSRAFRGEL